MLGRPTLKESNNSSTDDQRQGDQLSRCEDDLYPGGELNTVDIDGGQDNCRTRDMSPPISLVTTERLQETGQVYHADQYLSPHNA